jgi:hypothetical protein
MATDDPILSRIAEELGASADVPPPERVDRRIRYLLRHDPLPLRPVLRPALAAGLAVAALLALVSFLATLLAEAGAGARGPILALYVAWIYLGLSAAATLPLLSRFRQFRRAEATGAGR